MQTTIALVAPETRTTDHDHVIPFDPDFRAFSSRNKERLMADGDAHSARDRDIRTSRDRDLDVADALARLDERVKAADSQMIQRFTAAESVATLRHAELQASNAAKLVKLDELTSEQRQLKEWVEEFEATMVDEIRRIDTRIDEFVGNLATLRESTDSRFGTVANETASLRLSIADIAKQVTGTVKIAWVSAGWRVFAALVGLAVAGSAIAVALHTLGWHF